MAKNRFAYQIRLASEERARQVRREITDRCVKTMHRAYSIAINREFGFGKRRLDRLFTVATAIMEEYSAMIDAGDVEYADAKLEEAYNKIMDRGEEKPND